MKTIVMVVLAMFAVQLFAWETPEQMYGTYDKDGKYRQMREQLDQVVQQSEQAEKEKAAKRQIALWAAIAIGRQVLSKRTWKDNPAGTRLALAIGLAGTVLLTALNYGIFLLKIEYGGSFNTALAAVLVLLLTTGAIYAVRKKN